MTLHNIIWGKQVKYSSAHLIKKSITDVEKLHLLLTPMLIIFSYFNFNLKHLWTTIYFAHTGLYLEI